MKLKAYVVALLTALALVSGVTLSATSNVQSAEAVSKQRIINSSHSDQNLRVSRLFRGGSPKSRGTVPIGRESGFHPTRSFYLPEGCDAYTTKSGTGGLVHHKYTKTGWKDLRAIEYMSGKWYVELWCHTHGGTESW